MNAILHDYPATGPAPASPVEKRDRAAASTTLAPNEEQQVRELGQRDRVVRTHEQAHKSAGGAHAGGITYSYTTGPDGKRYATGGEVPIDVSPVEGDPAATIQKMQQVRRAALAPADPSPADRRIAAEASQREQEARAEASAGDGNERTDDRVNDPPAADPTQAPPGQLIDIHA